MTTDKVEEIVDFIAESKLSRMETAVKVRVMLTQYHQDIMSEVVEEILKIKVGHAGEEHWCSFSGNPYHAYKGGRQDAICDFRREVKQIATNYGLSTKVRIMLTQHHRDLMSEVEKARKEGYETGHADALKTLPVYVTNNKPL